MPGEDRFLQREYKDRIPEEIRETSWLYSNQDQIVEHFKPTAIVFANPDLNCLNKNHGVPIISDMHGPRLIEFELLVNNDSPAIRGRNLRRKLANFLKSHYFTCAGRLQRYYFLGFFLCAGFKLNEIKIEYMPVSLSPEIPTPNKDLEAKRFIFSGGFYPWTNPQKGLYILSDVLAKEQRGCLHLFGGSHKVNPEDSASFARLKKHLAANKRVVFRGYLSRHDVIEEYKTGYVAYELMERNFEREIAFTTRTLEFMWAGLPVIYNDYSDLSGYIKEYDAGWCVNPDDEGQVKKAIIEALNEPELVLAKSRNAQRLIKECFTWDKTIKPLVEFLDMPIPSRKVKDLSDSPVAYIFSGDNDGTIPGGSRAELSRTVQRLHAENIELKRRLEMILNSKTWRLKNKLEPLLKVLKLGR